MYLDHSSHTAVVVLGGRQEVVVVTAVALMVETVVQMAVQLEKSLLECYMPGLALVVCQWNWESQNERRGQNQMTIGASCCNTKLCMWLRAIDRARARVCAARRIEGAW